MLKKLKLFIISISIIFGNYSFIKIQCYYFQRLFRICFVHLYVTKTIFSSETDRVFKNIGGFS